MGGGHVIPTHTMIMITKKLSQCSPPNKTKVGLLPKHPTRPTRPISTFRSN